VLVGVLLMIAALGGGLLVAITVVVSVLLMLFGAGIDAGNPLTMRGPPSSSCCS
jgi:hypothetical protein